MLLRLLKTKRNFNRIEAKLQSGWTPMHRPPAARLYKRYSITRHMHGDDAVWHFAPREAVEDTPVILYLHGGAFLNGLLPAHWTMFAKWVDALGCTIVAPAYPLLPHATVDDAFALLLPLYRRVLAEAGKRPLMIVGESAGSALAVALIRQLLVAGVSPPHRLLLLSPWLDMSMSDPSIASQDLLDPLLDAHGLRVTGRLYAGSHDVRDPLVSPLYGSVEGFPPVTLFTGTHDVLLSDSRRFAAECRRYGVSIDYHEVEAMLHLWMFMPVPEAKKAFTMMVEALRDDQHAVGRAPVLA